MPNKKNIHIYSILTRYANDWAKSRPRQVGIQELAVINSFINYIAEDFNKKPKKRTVYDKCIICNKIDCICQK